MKNLYTKILRQKRFMMTAWFVGILAMIMLTLSVYNSFSAQGADLFKNLPAGLQKTVGSADSFKTIGGYISQQVFALRLPMLLIILSITLLVNLTAGDEQKGLLETQLSLPIGRIKLVLQKLAAAITIVCLASLGAVAAIELILPIIHQHYGLAPVLKDLIKSLVVSLDYGLVGFAIACLSGRRALALAVSGGFAFLSYLVNSLAPSVSIMATLDKGTLFHYYSTTDFVVKDVAGLAVVGVLLIVIGLVGFSRRDVRAS